MRTLFLAWILLGFRGVRGTEEEEEGRELPGGEWNMLGT